MHRDGCRAVNEDCCALKDSENSKLEDKNHQLHVQLQSAMDDVGEKTTELETVSIESGVIK